MIDALIAFSARRARARADAARDAGRWSPAAAGYRRWLAVHPADAAIWTQLGHMLTEAGDHDGAARAYAQADLLAPDDADLLLCWGHSRKRAGDIERATALYRRSFALDGNADAARELDLLAPEFDLPEPEPDLMEFEPDLSEAEPEPEPVEPVLAETVDEPEPQPVAQEPDPPRDEEPAPPPGLVDGWYLRWIAGWALPATPDAAGFAVEFRHEGRSVGRTVPILRADGRYGFRTQVDIQGDTPVTAHRLPDGAELAGSPIGMMPAAGRPAPPPPVARHAVVKPLDLPPGSEVALFVTHSATGAIKPHVGRYVEALARAGIAVLLLVQTDRPALLPDALLDAVAGAIVRDNAGYDFAAWADALALHPELFGAPLLYLVNDSLFGPSDEAAFAGLIDRVRASEADLVALTESHEWSWHVQSYFLGLKPRLLSSHAFHDFVAAIRPLDDKDQVIRAFEVPFAGAMAGAGLAVEVLFPGPHPLNPSLFGWRDLIAAGFPFVKLLLLRGAFPEIDIAGWRETLAAAGFDMALLEATLTAAAEHGPADGDRRLVALPTGAGGAVQRPLRVAFIGPWNHDNGLAAASRNLIGAIRRTGCALSLHPIKRPFHVHRPLGPSVDVPAFAGPADIAVVHLNPDSWHLLTDDQRYMIATAGRRIGYWVWEMEQLPPAWALELGSVDRIWAPSGWCAGIFAAAADVAVDVVPHPVPLPQPPTMAERVATLAAAGLAADARTILYVFDGSSYLVRKNPAALVRAFAASGLAARGWTLLLKTKHLMDRPEDGAAFRALAERTAGARLIDRSMDAAALDRLVAACDIYASPHCAEGFGLTVAEAMAHGRTVVAADYSGTTEYLDATCGMPVPAHAWTLDEDHGHYTAGRTWGRIDEPALAAALTEAAAAVEAGDGRLGRAARARVAERLSFDAIAARVAESFAAALAGLRLPPPPSRLHGDLSAGLPVETADLGPEIDVVALAPAGGPVPFALPVPDPARWVAFAPAGSIFSPLTEWRVRAAAAARPDAALLFGDDVALHAPDALGQIRLKPEFDPLLLAAADHVGAPVIVRADALAALGGLDPAAGTAALADLLLRAHAAGWSIARIPEVLLGHAGDRPRATLADRRAMLARLPAFASFAVEEGRAPGLLALSRRFAVGDAPAVTLAIPTMRAAPPEAGPPHVERLLAAVAETDWPMDRLAVLVGDDGEGEPDWSAPGRWPFALRRLATPRPDGAPFNYAVKMNRLWREAETEQIVFLNDDVLPASPGWLRALMSFAVDPGVGGVGARLTYPDGRLQHAGMAPLFGRVAHPWLGRLRERGTYGEWALAQRHWSMVTGAVFATRRATLEAVNGFDEVFSLEYNDVDLCLRLRTAGWRILLNPAAEFSHVEKASRGDRLPPGDEIARFFARWGEWLAADPAWHPGIDPGHLDIRPRWERDFWFA